MQQDLELVTIAQAARAVGKDTSNLSYYLSRNHIHRYDAAGNRVGPSAGKRPYISLVELRAFLERLNAEVQKHHQDGLEFELGFHDVAERDRTKHVHRLHPYMGKFIPQLVEWFLSRFFEEGQIILDPFLGSGTTLVQGNELGMHTIGIDISPFNCLIGKVKTDRYDAAEARREILGIEARVKEFSDRLVAGEASAVGAAETLRAECPSEYLHTWFAPRTLAEMLYYRALIPEYAYQDLLRVVLSRAVRSSRLIPHYDLATPDAPIPIGVEYWCRKHKRNCRPIEECMRKIHAYSEDTARRIETFDGLRSDKEVAVIQGDSRALDLGEELTKTPLAGRLVDGIFTSPPYVGQIDYHDQHIYAYELFGIPRRDAEEIGPKKRGKGRVAQREYAEGIAAVFANLRRFLTDEAQVFVVANDKFGLYPEIAERSGLKIVDTFQRAVTKRTEQGDDPYQETIFEMMKGDSDGGDAATE